MGGVETNKHNWGGTILWWWFSHFNLINQGWYSHLNPGWSVLNYDQGWSADKDRLYETWWFCPLFLELVFALVEDDMDDMSREKHGKQGPAKLNNFN